MPQLRLALLVSALLLFGSRAVAAPTKTTFDPATLRIDSLALGAPIATFEEKYAATLCDRDPIEQRTRTIWFHAPAPCRTAAPLPGGIIIVLYTKTKSPTDVLDAVAWFGDWPGQGSNFPVAIGKTLAEVEAVLGKAAPSPFQLEARGETLRVHRHGTTLYSIARGERIIGFIAGAMGADPNAESWRGLVGNVLRYLK